MRFKYTNMETLERAFGALREYPHVPDTLLALLVRTTCAQCDALQKIILDTARLRDYTQQRNPAVDFPYDRVQAARTFGLLLAIMQEAPDSNGAASTLHAALENGNLTLDVAFAAALHEDNLFFKNWEQHLPGAPSLPRFLLYAALLPSLMHYAEQQTEATAPAARCPVCGHPPLILYADDPATSACFRAVCSFCRYEFLTSSCPQCQNALHRAPDSNADTCYAVCDTCQSYLKILPSNDYVIPSVDDIRTLETDIQAAKKGFSRLCPPVWGL